MALQALQESVRSGSLPLAAAEEVGLVGAAAALLVGALAADDCPAAERAACALASMAAALASQGCPWPVRPLHCLTSRSTACIQNTWAVHSACWSSTACRHWHRVCNPCFTPTAWCEHHCFCDTGRV